MTLPTLAAVLFAALLHAGWNALLRGSGERVTASALMGVAMAAASALALLAVPLPAAASWPCAALSGLLHIGYMLALVATYRRGELGETYAVARGSSPALVALAGVVVAHERLAPLAVLGLALVCGGILALARGPLRREAVPAALLTGAFIAAYTVVDGVGVRRAGDALAYTALMSAGWGFALPAVLWPALRAAPRPTLRQAATGLAGGLVSLAAYGTVIWAMQRGAMGLVSALRETGVLFAALIGRLFLGEALTPRRLASCTVIALGAACLALAG